MSTSQPFRPVTPPALRRREAFKRICNDAATAASLSKSMAAIIQTSENPKFRRACTELLKQWAARQPDGLTAVDPNPARANTTQDQAERTKERMSIRKKIAQDILKRLHQTFVGK